MENPQSILPKFVRNIYFDHCSISKYINPKKIMYQTKKLRLTDYHRYSNKQKLRINWNCFPNLEELELYVYDVDLSGIENLPKLYNKKINTLI
jgi:hypothetical protein